MFRQFTRSRRFLAILLLAALALVQVKIALASCALTAPEGMALISVEEACPGCDARISDEKLPVGALERICGNHCTQTFKPPEHGPQLPDAAMQVMAIIDSVAAPPRIIASDSGASSSHKHPLLYRLQRLLI